MQLTAEQNRSLLIRSYRAAIKGCRYALTHESRLTWAVLAERARRRLLGFPRTVTEYGPVNVEATGTPRRAK